MKSFTYLFPTLLIGKYYHETQVTNKFNSIIFECNPKAEDISQLFLFDLQDISCHLYDLFLFYRKIFLPNLLYRCSECRVLRILCFWQVSCASRNSNQLINVWEK